MEVVSNNNVEPIEDPNVVNMEEIVAEKAPEVDPVQESEQPKEEPAQAKTAPTAEKPKKKKGKCCLIGCIIAFILFILLVIGLGVGGYFFVKNNVDSIKEMNPELYQQLQEAGFVDPEEEVTEEEEEVTTDVEEEETEDLFDDEDDYDDGDVIEEVEEPVIDEVPEPEPAKPAAQPAKPAKPAAQPTRPAAQLQPVETAPQNKGTGYHIETGNQSAPANNSNNNSKPTYHFEY